MPKGRPIRNRKRKNTESANSANDSLENLKRGLRALSVRSPATEKTLPEKSLNVLSTLWLPSRDGKEGLDQISQDLPDYEAQVSQKILRRNLIPILEKSVQVAVVDGDAALLGKLMDHSLGKAIEKRDSGGITEITMAVKMKHVPFSMMDLDQRDQEAAKPLEIEAEIIDQSPDKPCFYRNSKGSLVLEYPVG